VLWLASTHSLARSARTAALTTMMGHCACGSTGKSDGPVLHQRRYEVDEHHPQRAALSSGRSETQKTSHRVSEASSEAMASRMRRAMCKALVSNPF
jgi:hypothetical protein